MKKQSIVTAALLAFSGSAMALDLREFVGQTHDHLMSYNYADAVVLIQPDDFKGVEVSGSYVLKPNVAAFGGFSRATSDKFALDVTGSRFDAGVRYFFAWDQLQETDLDLSAALVRVSNKVSGGASASDSFVVLGSQLRHQLGRPVGIGSLAYEEIYGGLQVSVGGDDSSAAVHGGVLFNINEQFSTRTELLLDDGLHMRFGVRMKLGRAQTNPDAPSTAALQAAPAGVAPQATANADPYGLSADEQADLESTRVY